MECFMCVIPQREIWRSDLYYIFTSVFNLASVLFGLYKLTVVFGIYGVVPEGLVSFTGRLFSSGSQ